MVIQFFLRAKRASNLTNLIRKALSTVIDLKHRPFDRSPSCLFVPFVVKNRLGDLCALVVKQTHPRQRRAYAGVTMDSGFTHASNCSAVSSSRAKAASFSVVPSA